MLAKTTTRARLLPTLGQIFFLLFVISYVTFAILAWSSVNTTEAEMNSRQKTFAWGFVITSIIQFITLMAHGYPEFKANKTVMGRGLLVGMFALAAYALLGGILLAIMIIWKNKNNMTIVKGALIGTYVKFALVMTYFVLKMKTKSPKLSSVDELG